MLAVSGRRTEAGILAKQRAALIEQKTDEFRRLGHELVQLTGEPGPSIPIPPGSARAIIQKFCDTHNVRYGDIVGVSRCKALVTLRHRCIREVANARPDMSMPLLGRVFGGRDHTTILHALRKTRQPGDLR